jgi:two-component system chemotaxis response regulator CheB
MIGQGKIRVLIVDDSAFMRKALENMLTGEADIEIVGFGSNGEQAIEMAKRLKPDVMTLDVEMPQMDGISALQRIMKEAPLPVIMVSSLTQEGADTTLRALELGAVDFIPKEKSYGSIGILKITNEIRSKIRRFGRDKSIIHRAVFRPRPAGTGTATAAGAQPAHKTSNISTHKKIVALGTSTGGPQSLQRVIPLLPENLGVPILIVQHMPPNFTQSLATRLNTLSKVTVVEAQGGEHVQANYVYIAKGGKQMVIRRGGIIELKEADPQLLHNPSVDVMTQSVAEVYGRDALGVIMTGMGNDGAKGLAEMRQKGGFIISQDEESSIVYGMPRAVVTAGTADEIVTLDKIASRIAFHVQ